MPGIDLTASFESLLAGYSCTLAPLGEELLELADRDPCSPAYGCFCYPYWRSKSAGFANARCQEAVYSLALIYSRDYPGNKLKGVAEVLELARAGMLFWTGLQHRDGSFDEWFSGEHGFAATAFSSFAISRAFALLREDFSARQKEVVLRAFRCAGEWLSRRDDLAKLNHEAVAAAALLALADALAEPEFKKAATLKIEKILARQMPEGWFPELGGLDTGYCFLTVEYLCHCLEFISDDQIRRALVRALDFLLFFVHPDITTGREYNLCSNYYVSLLAAAVMARFHPPARRLFLEGSFRRHAICQPVQDDLSRCYHLYNGLLAYDHAARNGEFFKSPSASLPCHGEDFMRFFPQAGLLVKKTSAYYLVLATRHGGGFKMFMSSTADAVAVTDWGYTLGGGGKGWRRTGARQEPKSATFKDDMLEIRTSFRRIAYFFPSIVLRLLLDFAGVVPGAWALIKWATDRIRKSKQASLQLAAVATSGGNGDCRRLVRAEKDRLRVWDTVGIDGIASVSACRIEVEKTAGGLVVGRPLAGMEEELARRLAAAAPVEVKKEFIVSASGLSVEAVIELAAPTQSVDNSFPGKT